MGNLVEIHTCVYVYCVATVKHIVHVYVRPTAEKGKTGTVILHNTCTCKLFGQTEEKGTTENAWLIKGSKCKYTIKRVGWWVFCPHLY